MNHMELWKLATDVMLVVSLVYLSLRIARSPGSSLKSGRLVELEATLRALIKEADSSGRSLSDTLLKRQKGLEQLLTEIESAEQRYARSLNSSEEKKSELEIQISRAKQAQAALEETQTRAQGIAGTRRPQPERVVDAPKTDPALKRPRKQRVEVEVEREDDQFEDIEVGRVEQITDRPIAPNQSLSSQSRDDEATVAAPEPPSFVAAVQGGPAPTSKTTRARDRYAQLLNGLASKVERQVTPQIEEVFNAAEEIIRQGEEISSQTPNAAPSQKVTESDPRLGVLGGTGGIRRQVEVI